MISAHQGGLDRASALDLARTALFLDIDGTLAPIMSRPEAVGPSAPRTAILQALCARLNGRLAVISGRTIADIDRIVDGAVPAVAGVHGLERRGANGRVRRAQAHPALNQVRAELAAAAAALPGVLIEDKGLSLAIHFRAAPEAQSRLAAEARRIAADRGLTVQAGDMVVELRTPGQDKGDAITAFMAEPPFAGAIPIYVGDDLTDEAAFAAAARLGGHGVLVGPVRPTLARQHLADPEAVLGWLAEAVATETIHEHG